MILVDTSVWIGFSNDADSPEVEFLDSALGLHAIVIGNLIVTEFLQGFRCDKDITAAKSGLAEFEQLEPHRFVPQSRQLKAYRKLCLLNNDDLPCTWTFNTFCVGKPDALRRHSFMSREV